MAHKKFEPGQAIEVRRNVSAKVWEHAKYLRAEPGWRGWHRVELKGLRYVDSMSGMDCNRDNPRAFGTRITFVPTQRLRNLDNGKPQKPPGAK